MFLLVSQSISWSHIAYICILYWLLWALALCIFLLSSGGNDLLLCSAWLGNSCYFVLYNFIVFSVFEVSKGRCDVIDLYLIPFIIFDYQCICISFAGALRSISFLSYSTLSYLIVLLFTLFTCSWKILCWKTFSIDEALQTVGKELKGTPFLNWKTNI